MNSPLCPNCREQMSSVERGLGGVWSCLYCEGTWLSAEEVDALTARLAPLAAVSGATDSRSMFAPPAEDLRCPCCEAMSFTPRSAGPAKAHWCTGCRSLFFKKGKLTAAAPGAASSPFQTNADQLRVLGTVDLTISMVAFLFA